MSTEERKKQLREANKRWRDSHPEERSSRARKYMKEYRANNKESLRFAEIKRKYGLSKAGFEELVQKQDGRCAICGVAEALNVDHDHQTGSVRGLLCNNCNWGLGHFKDNLELLSKASKYLAHANNL